MTRFLGECPEGQSGSCPDVPVPDNQILCLPENAYQLPGPAQFRIKDQVIITNFQF